ncbi:hypothetical protein BOO91_08910 [Vibrio navarrensis]|nr:hypothetical protein [Vibrio navarrensis]
MRFFIERINEQSNPKIKAGKSVKALLPIDSKIASFSETPNCVKRNKIPSSVAPIPDGIKDKAPMIKPEQ